MTKYTVRTTKRRTITYYLTYEVEAESEDVAEQLVGEGDTVTPIDEEFVDETEHETIDSVESEDE